MLSGILALFSLMLATAGVGVGQSLIPEADPNDPSPHSDVWLISEQTSIRPGETFTVALRMVMDDDWHSYWKNPGDSGQATFIEWDLPEGFVTDDFQWPYPERVDFGPLTSYGYSGEVFLLTDITAPASLEPGTDVTLAGVADWLICAEICLLAEDDVSLTLPVSSGESDESEWADEFEDARRKQPVAADDWTVRALRSSGTYALHITPPEGRRIDLEGANFYPETPGTLDHAAAQPVTRDGRAFIIALQQSEYAQEPVDQMIGVLVAPEGESFVRGESRRALRIDAPVEESRIAGLSPVDAPESSLSLGWALLFALVGGVLLNLMPCVFPILSIKILGFARQSDDSNADIRRHGLIFAAGVLVSFWILAGLLLGLRAGGSQIGWGFQLQSPAFIALMAMLFFAIGLSLLGVFEVGGGLMRWGGRVERSAATSGASGSFLSGVLATIVATPCTAPFMGAALGVAFVLSAFEALAIFSALGVGMAFPYVALSMSPALLRRLPKPGQWMETLKQVLAFPMFATVIWLIWVFGQQVGNDGVALLLFGLMLLGLAVWVLGRWSAARISGRARVITRAAATLGIAGALALGLLGTTYDRPTGAAAGSSTDGGWHTFSSAAVGSYQAEGRPVFVDFTAAWCLTCQVNKRTTLRSDEVTDAFRDHNVVLMRADWTNQDPEITRALEELGRNGVPVYALYPGDGSPPVLLPEILTRDIVLDALADLPGEAVTDASL